jgi:hypothetical protein
MPDAVSADASCCVRSQGVLDASSNDSQGLALIGVAHLRSSQDNTRGQQAGECYVQQAGKMRVLRYSIYAGASCTTCVQYTLHTQGLEQLAVLLPLRSLRQRLMHSSHCQQGEQS